jgi:hypothetical protein
MSKKSLATEKVFTVEMASLLSVIEAFILEIKACMKL